MSLVAIVMSVVEIVMSVVAIVMSVVAIVTWVVAMVMSFCTCLPFCGVLEQAADIGEDGHGNDGGKAAQ